MATKKTIATKAPKTPKKIKDVSICLPNFEGIDSSWAMFQENDKVYVFHFCGADEKSQWFRKTDDWDAPQPKCEVCKSVVPDQLAAVVKLHHSGL